MTNKEKNYTLIEYLLLAFMPFTGPSSDLLYHRGKFIRKIMKSTGSGFHSIESTLTRAKKNGYLESVEKKGKEGLRLTNRGRMKVLGLVMNNKKEKWDGQWRILIFDIPERKRKTRDAFRRMLAELGFKKYQISVWICPYDRSSEIEMIIDEFDLQKYVQYFISKSITDEEKIKKIFELE